MPKNQPKGHHGHKHGHREPESDAMPERGTPEYDAIRSRNARNNVLLFLIFTVINLVILFTQSNRTNFLFSAWFPYWQEAGWVFSKAGVEGVGTVFPILGFLACALLLVIYIFWKKSWLIPALFALVAVADTLYLGWWVVAFWPQVRIWKWTFDLVLTFIYHIMVLYYAWTGVTSSIHQSIHRHK